MLTKLKLPALTLVLSILNFLSSHGVLCQGYDQYVPYPGTHLRSCVERCREKEDDISGILSCVGRCERELDDREYEIERCKEECQREGGKGRDLQRCKRRCEEGVIDEREKERDIEDEEEQEERRSQENGGREEKDPNSHENSKNPYYFPSQEFKPRFETPEGRFLVLKKFSHKSEHLQGIEKYRLGILEANPSTFEVPYHWDAYSVLIVLRGKATIVFVAQESRDSYNLQPGDVIKINEGTTVYLINHDDSEMFKALMLIHPVNIPGKFEEFFSGGGKYPETFYEVFSNDILEAALATPRDELEKLFGQQMEGGILKASPEQLKSWSQSACSENRSHGKKGGPFNLFNQPSTYSNDHGIFFEASPKFLKELDISVEAVEMQQGALLVPNYNSRTIVIGFVEEGTARLEMACPHLGSHGHGRQHGRYQKIVAWLTPGDVFIIPAGHPFAVLASKDQNLRIVAFGINARHNQRNFLAGRDNIVNLIEKEAKKLSFNNPADFIDRIFRNQKDSYFVSANYTQQQGSEEFPYEEKKSGRPLSSIMDFI